MMKLRLSITTQHFKTRLYYWVWVQSGCDPQQLSSRRVFDLNCNSEFCHRVSGLRHDACRNYIVYFCTAVFFYGTNNFLHNSLHEYVRLICSCVCSSENLVSYPFSLPVKMRSN